jgi:hypothetical protein
MHGSRSTWTSQAVDVALHKKSFIDRWFVTRSVAAAAPPGVRRRLRLAGKV